MARSFPAFALTSLLASGFALAQPDPHSSPAPPPAPPDGRYEKCDRDLKDAGPRRPLPPLDADNPMGRFKKKLDQMSPEERQHFQDNWKRWKQMGDSERKAWQQRAVDERARIKKIVDDTLAKLGLDLNSDQREVFVLRYRQERRKIEEQLSSEMEAKRKVEIDGMLQRLKAEFSTPTPTPAPSATPAAAR